MSEETQKAHAIERRHKYQCAICMAIDVDNANTKFHVFSEAVAVDEDDSVVCDSCLKDIVAIRKMCNQKIDNPAHDPFKDFLPSFVKDMPGLREAFKKILA